jgi:hypothetical protein
MIEDSAIWIAHDPTRRVGSIQSESLLKLVPGGILWDDERSVILFYPKGHENPEGIFVRP